MSYAAYGYAPSDWYDMANDPATREGPSTGPYVRYSDPSNTYVPPSGGIDSANPDYVPPTGGLVDYGSHPPVGDAEPSAGGMTLFALLALAPLLFL